MEKTIVHITSTEMTETYKAAMQTHQRILANGEICAQSLLEICKDLKTMRDDKLYEEFGYASFDEYTENAVGIKPRQAYTYISTYERLGSSVLQSNASLGITKLDLIAQINPVERMEMLSEGTFDGMSVSEIREIVKKAKDQGEQISLLQEQLEEAKTEAAETEEHDAEKDEMRSRIAELEKKLTESRAAHEAALEQAKREAAESTAQKDPDEAEKKRIEAAVKAAKREAKKEKDAAVKEEQEKQAEKIKALEAALEGANAEQHRLEKQLELSDTASAKAMVYIKALQDNFNALFALLGDMPEEQQNKFKGAVLKLTAAMQKQAEG